MPLDKPGGWKPRGKRVFEGGTKGGPDMMPCNMCNRYTRLILVTDGMRDNGTLRVLNFCSREHAAYAGYGWVRG